MTHPATTRRLLLLDAGGVVLDGLATHHVVTNVAATTGADPAAVRRFFDHHVNVLSSTGQRDEWWAFDQLQHQFGPVDPEHLARVAREKTQGLPGVWHVLTRLRPHLSVWMLSNYIAEWLRDALRFQRLHSHFDHLFISSESGLRKPAPEAFLQVVSAWGGPADTIAFVDDKVENTQAATAVGMHAIHSISDPHHWEKETMAWLARS
jgi:HAD superfamily hydrolase (TIGR01509 family)